MSLKSWLSALRGSGLQRRTGRFTASGRTLSANQRIERLEDRCLLTTIDLATLSGASGFRIDGVDSNDFSGRSVSSAGDVNGDGFDDLIIGAEGADPGGNSFAGESYVVFGKSGSFNSGISLSTLNGSNGFRLDGIDASDLSGRSVSSAGDVNGDGFDDLIIGASSSDPGGMSGAGESYVVFGKSGGFASAIDLAGLDGVTGFRLDGIDESDLSGRSVSSAGDVNGDGFDDLIIGAIGGDPGGSSNAGESYVFFGKSGGFSATFDLSSLDGTNGFRLDGIDINDNSGVSVSNAGDVNGDGFGDLIIGANTADPGGNLSAGETYVVFGKFGGFTASVDLDGLDGTTGFRLDGIDATDISGASVSNAGDVNGDGFDDLIIGAGEAEQGARNGTGETYVVFGKTGAFAASVALDSLDGTNGFRLDGVFNFDHSGESVSGAGDVNGDGFDDLIIGASGFGLEGASFVVFGKSGGFTAVMDLGPLASSANLTGIRLDGIDSSDRSGYSVSEAGDVNGDGFDDLIIGSDFADPGARSAAGESHVVFGGNFTGGPETQVGGPGNETRTANQGSGAIDILIGGGGDDLLISDGGSDVLRGGQGDDRLTIPDADFTGTRRIVGGSGTDTLEVTGSGITLDLTSIADNRIVDVEVIDVTGAGDNTLILSVLDVLNISSHSNTLTVLRDAADVLDIGNGWIGQGIETVGPQTFAVFSQRAAILRVQSFGGTISGTVWNDVNQDGVNDAAENTIAGTLVFLDDNQDGQWQVDELLAETDAGGNYVFAGLSAGGYTVDHILPTNSIATFPMPQSWSMNLASDENATGFDFGDLLLGSVSGAVWRDVNQNGVQDSGETTISGWPVFLDANDNGVLDTGEVSTTSNSAGEFSFDGLFPGDYAIAVAHRTGWTHTAPATGTRNVTVNTDDDLIDLDFGLDSGFHGSSLPLSDLDGLNGFVINGIQTSDRSGTSVSNAGDVNGDGFDDLIIGAYGADPGGNSSAGESYVVFGKPTAFAASVELDGLDGTNGFRLQGVDSFDRSGKSVSSADDVNGDGFDDLTIGAYRASADGNASAGVSVVVFGKSAGFAGAVDLDSLDGTNGFRVDGIDASDFSGSSVSSAGDVNGDGYDDLIIGATGADPGGQSSAGESYVVFGNSSGFAAAVDLAALDGTNGFRLDGVDLSDRSGISVSSAGDVNGDGIDDLLIGAREASLNGKGESYVVFGTTAAFPPSLELASLNGANGFRLQGIDNSDHSGISVSSAGDVNGDGADDLIIGAVDADPGLRFSAGESYVVFGNPGGFAAVVDLNTLDGTNGFQLNGIDASDNSGTSVAGAGDVNGDGFDDLIIGADRADPGGRSAAGESYVVFGKSGGFGAAVELSVLDGTDGFRLDGIDPSDLSGASVSNAGDLNGDGFDDVIIGAYGGDPGGHSSAGESYVIFGGNFTGGFETQIGTGGDDPLTADLGVAVDVLIGGRGNDNLISDGGSDVLRGAAGDDRLTIPNGDFSGTRRIVGGSGIDTLELNGGGINLDLTTIPDNRIIDVEVIDITGTGDNTLILNLREVLNISSHSNTLTVLRDAADVVEIGSGWIGHGLEIDGSQTFAVFSQGAATLRVQSYPGYIQGSVWRDLNQNGIDDNGEPRISERIVFIDTNINGVPDASEPQAASAIDGSYVFANLAPGTYRVSAVLPPGWTETSPAPDHWDVTIGLGTTVTGIDFGTYEPPASISGLLWSDENQNGTREAGEPGRDGWLVFLDADGDGTHDPGENSTTTDTSGAYTLAGLYSGSHTVVQEQRSGWVETFPGTGGTEITLASGQDVVGVEFGSTELASISGLVWTDLDQSGTQGAGEAGLEGWTVFLDDDGDGNLDAGEVSVATDVNGAYAFPDLDVGSHTVVQRVPFGFLATFPVAGNWTFDLTSGEHAVGANFGRVAAASISGSTFYDSNQNGFREPEETGVPNWTVFIDDNDDGILDAGETSLTTDPLGDYFIPDLFPGSYHISALPRPGWVQTSPVAGNWDLVVSVGEALTQIDFGNHAPHTGPAYIELSTLDGTNGFSVPGIAVDDRSGRSVSSAGDINGDGFDDVIIGADYADPGGDSRAGESYVIFGKSTGYGSTIDPAGLNGVNGFRLDGIDASDRYEEEDEMGGYLTIPKKKPPKTSIDDALVDLPQSQLYASVATQSTGQAAEISEENTTYAQVDEVVGKGDPTNQLYAQVNKKKKKSEHADESIVSSTKDEDIEMQCSVDQLYAQVDKKKKAADASFSQHLVAETSMDLTYAQVDENMKGDGMISMLLQ